MSNSAAVGSVLLFLLIGSSVIAVYIVPGIVASYRQVPNAGSVWVLNILLGWSLIGWAVAMAMACRSKYQPVMLPYAPPPPPPPYN